MTSYCGFVAGATLFLASVSCALANQVRIYEENGITYRETRRTVRRPVVDTEMRDCTRTVYREKWNTEMRRSTRTCWTPVTECRCEAEWVGRWNPFVEPYLVYRPTARTRWEPREEVVEVPVNTRQLFPETKTVRVPVTTHRIVDEEVVTRVALSPRSPSGLTPVAPSSTFNAGRPVGGMAQLENDPPRHGINTAWRPAAPDRRQ